MWASLQLPPPLLCLARNSSARTAWLTCLYVYFIRYESPAKNWPCKLSATATGSKFSTRHTATSPLPSSGPKELPPVVEAAIWAARSLDED